MVQRKGQHDQFLICDTIEDLRTTANVSMGSTCYVIATAETYMANSSGQWVRQTLSTNGGGSSEDSVIDTIRLQNLEEQVDVLQESAQWGFLNGNG